MRSDTECSTDIISGDQGTQTQQWGLGDTGDAGDHAHDCGGGGEPPGADIRYDVLWSA